MSHDELERKLNDSIAAPMLLPLEFLKTITCDFSTEMELGRGGYGVVYKGVLRSGKIIAVKKLFELHIDDKTFQKEVSCLKEIKHHHVVQFIGYCAESSWELIDLPGRSIWAEIPKRLLCFEYVCNKSLDKYISVSTDESSALGWNMRYEIIKGICSGLNFLHEECRIVHLNLKPENILMDASMVPKIADFGLSRMFSNQQSRIITDNRAGTRGYMAPEYWIRGIISMKADIFSLGVIIIEILTGCRKYPDIQLDNPQSTVTSCQQYTEKVLGSWRNKFESSSKYISMEKYNLQVKQCISIALNCVDPSMDKRPTAKDIIQVVNAVDKMEANEELPAELQCKDKSLVLDSTVSNDLMLHSATEDMSNIKTDGTVGDAKNSQECLLPMPLWTSSTSSQNHLEAANESNEPQQASDKTSEMEPHKELQPDKSLVLNTITSTETEVIPGSSALLDVYPLELQFGFKPNKSIACSLDLTNNTDEQVAFGLVKKTHDQTCFLSRLPMFGIVDPKTTYALVSIPPSIKIISMEDIGDYCMDVNQTEPLIITSQFRSSSVQIWDSDTQKSMGSITISKDALVWSVKFIARMGWFLAGTNDGFIHVCNYKNETQNITSIRAHGSYLKPQGCCNRSLAIHPTQSYVLSACNMTIKLLDWNHRWKCMRTFKEHSDVVLALAFNPEDYKSFASASCDRTIKVWSLDSPKSKYTLSGHSDYVRCLEIFMLDGQQCLITGSDDKTAKLWDMQKEECVHTLPHRSEVYSVLPHPKLPVLVTGTADGHVYLWSSVNFRLKRILNIGGFSNARGLACLIESGRIVVAHTPGLSVIEIRDEEEQGGGGSSNSESSISATD